jgi:Ca2+-binding EF-hand superfamily protein
MKLFPLTLALFALASTAAFAADEKPKGKGNPEELFKKLDTNGDGSLSLDEYKAGPAGKKDPAKAEESFKKHDKNADGKLSLEEMTAGGGKKKEKAAN